MDSSNGSNDALDSTFTPGIPRSFLGIRSAEVLLIGDTMESRGWNRDSGARVVGVVAFPDGARWRAAAGRREGAGRLTLLRGG